MAKQKRKTAPSKIPYPVKPKSLAKSVRNYAAFDSFTNDILNLGSGSNNALLATDYRNTVNENFKWQRLRAMYNSNGLARRLIEMEAEDMTREGVEILGDIDPSDIKEIQVNWDNMLIQTRMFEAISQGRLYGGAILYIHINGQDPSTPLDVSTVGEGQFAGVKVFDRWQLIPSINEVDFFTNIPMSYQVLDAFGASVKVSNQSQLNDVYEKFASGVTIHSSRVIRFDGDFLPYIDYLNNQMWHSSILVNMMDLITNYNTTTGALAAAAYKSSFRVVKVGNLEAVIAAGKTGRAADTLQSFIQKMRIAESAENITVMSSDDNLEIVNYDLTGMIAGLEQFQKQLSLRGYPATKLFGESPGGLNATGDNETRMYYDKIKNQQEKIRPDILKLLKVIWQSTFGTEPPEDYNFNYTPLWQMDQTEKSTISQQTTDSVIKAYESGIIGKNVALEELLQSSDITGIWTNITDEDIAEAEKEDEDPPSPDESMLSMEQANNLLNAQNSSSTGQTPPVDGSLPDEQANSAASPDSTDDKDDEEDE